MCSGRITQNVTVDKEGVNAVISKSACSHGYCNMQVNAAKSSSEMFNPVVTADRLHTND